MLKPEKIRQDFPIFERKIEGKSLVYLDSAATSQKPRQVIEAVSRYYEERNANVHRGAHTLGDEATEDLEEARGRVAEFIGAGKQEEVVFVKNATEAINLVAYSWGEEKIKEGDVILLTEMEHHANIVPWQELAKRVGAELRYVEVDEEGVLEIEDYLERLDERVRLVGLVHVSNTLGTVNRVRKMVEKAREVGARVLVDGAQAVPHMRVDVLDLGADFYVFSGHKMLAPMSIGVLWGKEEVLEKMRPFLSGGGMVREVRKKGSSFKGLPERFEAGTPNVAGAVGLREAVDYLEGLGMDEVRKHDKEMVRYALERLGEIEEVDLLGPEDSDKRVGSVSFVYRGVHGHDVSTVLDTEGVAVRSGHHCTMLLHEKLKVKSSVRASFNVYTTKKDIDRLVEGLGKVKETFGGLV